MSGSVNRALQRILLRTIALSVQPRVASCVLVDQTVVMHDVSLYRLVGNSLCNFRPNLSILGVNIVSTLDDKVQVKMRILVPVEMTLALVPS